jgi:NADH-ubiquinone oxidoreductase chain 5
MWIGIAALSALPLVGGYFTKDIIIEISSEVKWIWIISIIGAYYTTLYSSNVISILIHPESITNVPKKETSLAIIIPLIILSVLTLIIGYLIKDMIIGIGTDVFNGSLSSNKNKQLWIDSPEGINITLIEKLLPTILSIIMIGSELSIYW